MEDFYYQPQYTALYLRSGSYACYSKNEWGFRPDGSEDFSLTLWFWPDCANGRLIDGKGVFTLDLRDDQFIFWLKGYSDLISSGVHYPIIRHDWNHITITYNHLGQISFYINGISTDVFSVFQGEPADTWGEIKFFPGMQGYLRSVQFFSKQLSDDEVDQVKRNLEGAPLPIRWFDFETVAPKEKITGTSLLLSDGAAPYALADGLFCDNGAGFFPLDGSTVNPAASQDAPYTVQAWISIYDQEQSFAILFMNGRHSLDCGMVLYLEKDDAGYHLCAGRGAHIREENILRSAHTIPTRAWHNVAVTYDGTAMHIFVDGIPEGEKTELTPFTETMDCGLLRIGTDDLPGLSSNEGCFHGAFGNIAVWNRALTPEELKQYANVWPQYGESGLMADYIFTRYSCYNAVNGFEVGTSGVDISKICRNPIKEDLPHFQATDTPTPSAVLRTIHGKTVTELHRERAKALPDAEQLLRTALADDEDRCLYRALLPGINDYLSQMRTGQKQHPFYHCEMEETGQYYFYLVSDQIYQAGVFSLAGQGEFAAWLIRFLSTLVIDVFSIYCVLPQQVSAGIPKAFSTSLLNDRANLVFTGLKDKGLSELVSTVCKFLLGGGLLAHIIELLRSEGIRWGTANLLALVGSFLAKAGTFWGWVMMVVRVGFLIVDLSSLYLEMPKLLGAELIQLCFQTDRVFVSASHDPGSRLSAQWQEGLNKCITSPVVCCLRQARSADIFVTARFAVYTSGTYEISAEADSEFPLGKISAKNVRLKAGKDGTCTAQLVFTEGTLASTGIGDISVVLKWTIKGVNTVKQETPLRVFFIYDLPQNPWGGKDGFGTPWAEALAWACAKAANVTGKNDAEWSENIIKAMIKGLWNDLEYQAKSVYVFGTKFYLTRCLNDLKIESKKTTGKEKVKVNDNDCAALLVALCNLLGCDLSSVLLRGEGGAKLSTNSVIPVGSEVSKKFDLESHETVVELRGLVPYYSDLSYKILGQKENEYFVMRPFHTAHTIEESTLGYCEMLLEEACQDKCIIPNDQRAIGNGKRTIL